MHKIRKYFELIVGMFIIALAFNLFINPLKVAVGGTNGLAIIINEVFGINTTLFIKPKLLTLMNKTELVSSIATKAGLSKADSKKALDACVEAIVGALKADDKVSLVGFGTFSVAKRPARQGINPATKKPITIAAKKVAKFKAGSDLDAAIN